MVFYSLFFAPYTVIQLYNTACPTSYRTRHFFNNSNTNEDIATKFEQEYVRCVRNEEKSGNLNFLEPSGHLGPVTGLIYLYLATVKKRVLRRATVQYAYRCADITSCILWPCKTGQAAGKITRTNQRHHKALCSCFCCSCSNKVIKRMSIAMKHNGHSVAWYLKWLSKETATECSHRYKDSLYKM